jgi:hypothetical protein
MARFHRPSPLALVVLAFLLLLGGFISWNLAIPEQDARVLAIRQKGYPSSLGELDAWYVHIPDSQNAALILTNAFSQPALTNAFTVVGDTNWVPARGHLIDKDRGAELSAVLTTNQTLLALFHSATALTNSRYPIDLNQRFQQLLPYLAKVKGSVQLLTAEALFDASNGDIEKALEALRAAGAVSDSLAEEPLLISQLVRYASWAIIWKRCELILNGAALSDPQLNTLQTLFQNAEKPNAMVRGLAGERASGLAVFMGSPDRMYVFGVDMNSPPALKDRLRTSLYIGLLKSTGLLRKDRAFYLDVMATNIAAAEAPFPERLTLAQQANTAALSPPSKLMIFSRILLPALGRAMQRDGDHTARIRTAQTAIAVERFRRAHNGKLPTNLNELVPTYLPSIPRDPFDGQPLRFKRLNNSGYVVYSIGSDLRDDGGSEGDPKKQSSAKDITFILER